MNDSIIAKCPFCGQDLIREGELCNAKSVEHIIPYSLGNESLILGKGIICDKCNNYFALKIEKPFLELSPIKLLRSYHLIESRKKNVPSMNVRCMDEVAPLKFNKKLNGFILEISPLTCMRLLRGEHPDLLLLDGIDIESLRNNEIVSKMLAKIFMEIHLFYTIGYLQETGSDEPIYFKYDAKIKSLIEYVRFGKPNKICNYTVIRAREIIPFNCNDDFIARVELQLNKDNELCGMLFKLYELEFSFHLI